MIRVVRLLNNTILPPLVHIRALDDDECSGCLD